jgi:MOSC domain-containing protein YiiM
VNTVIAHVVSAWPGPGDDPGDDELQSIQVELDGVVGDSHQGFERSTWSGDKQPKGTIRRNERQWSAVSIEELTVIQEAMDLNEPLSAPILSTNLCLSGVAELSRLPKGTILKFPSGVVLTVVEYNPPCRDMGEKIASLYTSRSGKPIEPTAFSKAAKLTRGVVGVVDVAGTISVGDEVSVEIYKTPAWLARSAD